MSERESGPMVTGLVTPLVKIGQHFQGPEAQHVLASIAWLEMKPIEKEKHIKAVLDGQASPWIRIVAYTEKADIEDVIHDAIVLWLVPCIELLMGVNRPKMPESVADFYLLVKQMINYRGDTRYWGENWRYNANHWAKLYSEFQNAVLDIDENLLEIQSTWGDSEN